MAELRVWTDLARNTVALNESPGSGLAPAPQFTVFARATTAPADAHLVISLPRGFFLPDDDIGERDARPDIEVGWQVEAAPEPLPVRGTIAVRLLRHNVVVASAQLQVSTLIEGHGRFDPERDAFRYPAGPHLFGTPRPPRSVFDQTFRRGLRAPWGWLLYRGLYRRLFATGIAAGMARAALAFADGSVGGPRPADRRLLDRETREQVQVLHGRQIGDRPVGALRHWIGRGTAAQVVAAIRRDLRADRPQRLAIDIGLRKVRAWSVFGAIIQSHPTVVPYHYRLMPNGMAIVDVYDPDHPGDLANSTLHIDIEAGHYEYRQWASDGPFGHTVLAAIDQTPFRTPPSVLQAGLAQAAGLA